MSEKWDPVEIDRLHAQVFGSDAGQRLIEYWQAVEIERKPPAGECDISAVRYMDGRRSFVLDIKNRLRSGQIGRSSSGSRAGG